MQCINCFAEGATKKRQMTQYHDDEDNYAILCDACQSEANEYWQELWDEYYRGCM